MYTLPDGMFREVHIPIVCGKFMCTFAEGKVCPYVGAHQIGTDWVCTLFPDGDTPYTRLTEEPVSNWLQRCEDCLEAEFEMGMEVLEK